MILEYDNKQYDLTKSKTVKKKASKHWLYPDQQVYYIEVDLGEMKKTKRFKTPVSVLYHLGQFPDEETVDAVMDMVEYLANKRKGDTIVVKIKDYKDLMSYVAYKHTKKTDITYKQWSKRACS